MVNNFYIYNIVYPILTVKSRNLIFIAVVLIEKRKKI